MENESEREKNICKAMSGNSYTWHKRKHQELIEKSHQNSLNSKLGITEKKFKKNENFIKSCSASDVKGINYHSCFFSPLKSNFQPIYEVNSCRPKEVTNMNLIFDEKKINEFSSQCKNEKISDNNLEKENTSRINNFKKKIKSSEEIILEEMSRFKFTAHPLKKNLFSKSKVKAKSCSQFIKEKEKKNANLMSVKTSNVSKILTLKQEDNPIHSSLSLTTNKIMSDKKENYFNNLLKTVKINEFNASNTSNDNESYKNILQSITNEETTTKKDSISNISTTYPDLNSKNQKNNFKARIIPNFTFLEVKKSNRSLTVPRSPQLKTKERSVSKFKEQIKLNEISHENNSKSLNKFN